MKIGDIYWFVSKGEIAHPHVIIAVDVETETLTLCGLTTNLKKKDFPGNVLLDKGEGGLDVVSIVEVSKTIAVKQGQLKSYIGSLNSNRVKQIQEGIGFINRSFLRTTKQVPRLNFNRFLIGFHIE